MPVTTPPARTVILVRPTAVGGLLAHMREECRLLRESGVRVIDVGPREGRLDADLNVSAPICAAASLREALAAVLALRGVLRGVLRHAPDAAVNTPRVAVHAHGVRAGALAALALCAFGGSARRVPLVTTLHNAPPTAGMSALLARILHVLACVRSTCVLAVSPDVQDIAWRCGARRVVRAVIPAPEARNGDSAGRKTHADPGRYILVLARLSKQKGLDVLLDAVGSLCDDTLPTVLIAGDGPLRDHLQRRIERERLGVELLGHRSDVSELLAGAMLVIQPSLWEGQPVAIQEALRARKAIIATDAGGTRWVTHDAAMLIPPDNPADLAAAMRTLLTDCGAAQERERLESAAAVRAAHLPTAQDLATQLSRVLELPTLRTFTNRKPS